MSEPRPGINILIELHAPALWESDSSDWSSNKRHKPDQNGE
jgi:hypothetical protein